MRSGLLVGIVFASALFTIAPTTDAQTARPSATSVPVLTYVVKPGDTLIDLARVYLIHPADYHTIQQLNGVADPRRLRIGQSLTLPVHLLRVEPVLAEVQNFRGPVTLDNGAGPQAPTTNQAVAEGAIITTGANASLRIGLSDGSHIAVPSNSRVRLTRLRRFLINGAVDHSLEVQRGRLESRVAPRQFPGGYRVTTPVSVTAVRGTDFRVNLSEAADRASTEVLEGRVEVEWGDQPEPTEAVANHAVSISSQGMIQVPLPPAPELKDPDTLLTQPETVISILPQAGAVSYRGRLALDAGLIDTIAEFETEASDARLDLGPLEDGLYYLRVTSINADGIEGLGNVYSLVRIQGQISPFGNQGLSDPRRRAYRFGWAPGGISQDIEARDFHYRFVLHRLDENGHPIDPPVLDRVGLEHPYVSLLGLGRGVYSWRVQTSQTLAEGIEETWSEPQILRIGK